MSLLLYVCASLCKVLPVDGIYTIITCVIHNQCEANKDSKDEALGHKY